MAESRKRNMISSSNPHSLLSGRKNLLTVKDSLQIKTKADQSKWFKMKTQESQILGSISLGRDVSRPAPFSFQVKKILF